MEKGITNERKIDLNALAKMNGDIETFICALYHLEDKMEKIYHDFDGNDEGEIAYDIKDASRRLRGAAEEVEDLIFKLAEKTLRNPMEVLNVFSRSN